MTNDPWRADLLKVKVRGETFTNLIKSIDDSKVVSIEAGFRREEEWAHLQSAANGAFEPRVTDAAACTKGGFSQHTSMLNEAFGACAMVRSKCAS